MLWGLIPVTGEYFVMADVSMLLETLGDLRRGLDYQATVTGIISSHNNCAVNAREVVDCAKQQLPDTYFFRALPEAAPSRTPTVAV